MTAQTQTPQFTTKDSGQRIRTESGMQREPKAGQPRFDLLVPLAVPYEHQMLTRVAALVGRGANKYDARDWEQACTPAEAEEFRASAHRHFMQWMCGEIDEDHAAAAVFNVLAFETTQYAIVQKGVDRS